MLLFLPQIILSAALAGLLASNLIQRSFRSSWLLTSSSAGLALASLIFLRLRLPLSLNFSAWWAGEGLVSSISFLMDSVSWQIGFILCALVLAFLLGEVQKALSASWLNWAGSLALAVASLLAVVSGDFLTLAFFWILVDAMSMLLVLRLVPKAEERRVALGFLPANIAASFLLIAAGVATGPGGQAASLLILLAAALRFEVFSPIQMQNKVSLDSNQATFLRLLPKASVIVLLARSAALTGPVLFLALAIIFLPAFFNSLQWMQGKSTNGILYFERGFSCLALLASAMGQPGIALAFGLGLLVAGSLLSFAQYTGRFRWMIIVPTLLLYCYLPFSQTVGTSQTPDSNWLTVLFLPVHAMLMVGWLRQLKKTSNEQVQGEPWMRAIQIFGIFLLPLIFLLFVLGLTPSFIVKTEVVWWPAVVVLALAVVIFFFGERGIKIFKASVNLTTLFNQIWLMNWLKRALDWALDALDWALHVVSRVLEGRAGVLWALLLIAILLSVASQFTVGG